MGASSEECNPSSFPDDELINLLGDPAYILACLLARRDIFPESEDIGMRLEDLGDLLERRRLGLLLLLILGFGAF
jgi:hypothetical protein